MIQLSRVCVDKVEKFFIDDAFCISLLYGLRERPDVLIVDFLFNVVAEKSCNAKNEYSGSSAMKEAAV